MNEKPDICDSAEALTRSFFHIYLEKRNFSAVKAMLHPNISWFGTTRQEVCTNLAGALELLEQEEQMWKGSFQILSANYHTTPTGDSSCIVYGEMQLAERVGEATRAAMDARFSVTCMEYEGVLKLLHCHYSVANDAHLENQFIYKTLVNGYNARLEKMLRERTISLQNRMEEFKSLTDNIIGGVELCSVTEGFPILYLSEGFIAMTGYTLEDLRIFCGGRHINLVHPADRTALERDIPPQLELNGSFSITYRIIRKDGVCIWVLDKGMVRPDENGQPVLQCILTDITSQKEQEEALLISERRYEIAMRLSDIAMFEYDITTGELHLFEDIAKMYQMPPVVPDGVNTFIKAGIILPETIQDYLKMFRRIRAGAPFAQCFVKSRDAEGIVHDFELSLTTVFDSEGRPNKAIGVRKNLSEIHSLKKEQEYSKNLALDKLLIFEADITNNRIEYLNKRWEKRIGMSKSASYSDTVLLIIRNSVIEEHQQMLQEQVSAAYIKKRHDAGENIYWIDYRRKMEDGSVSWHQATINIITDQITGGLIIRFYHTDIDATKRKQLRAQEEQHLYESMINKAIIAYEVNITQNQALKGHETWNELYSIQSSTNYTDMILQFAKKAIHPEDSVTFLGLYHRDRVLALFERGERQIPCQYRKLDADGNYRWVNCTLHLYEDAETEDVKGFSYVEDIDEQKRKELELKYKAEHDAMTSIYNKVTTEHKIKKFLASEDAVTGYHAFLMVDLDYFKYVNDNFGHLYGDQVIKEAAYKIRSLFREDDIVGRIGGDEFCVLMRNAQNLDVVMGKAEEICTLLRATYVREGVVCSVTASVGIAIYKEHGFDYAALFQHADAALYRAKKDGRNCYRI